MTPPTAANPLDLQIAKRLGDPHNFGRATSQLVDGRILKPRSVFWEEALLSPRGSLRLRVRELWHNVGGLIDAMPEVSYQSATGLGSIADPVQLTELPARALNDRELEGCGSTMAVCLFFGVHDLHRENILCGMDQNHRFVFGPVDLECVMARLPSLVATHLLPQPGLSETVCGLAAIKEHLVRYPRHTARARLIAAFCAAVSTLYQARIELDATLRELAMAKDAWLRVVLRATSHYHKILSQAAAIDQLRIPLIPEEKLQLERGDIPYFCRSMSQSGLWYFHTPQALQEVAPHPGLTAFRLTELRDLGAAWDMEPVRAQQMRQSALELARFLVDEPNLSESAAGIELEVCGQQIAIRAHGHYQCA